MYSLGLLTYTGGHHPPSNPQDSCLLSVHLFIYLASNSRVFKQSMNWTKFSHLLGPYQRWTHGRSTIGCPHLFKRWQSVPKIHTLRKRCTRLSGIRRFMVENNPAVHFSPLDSSYKRCMNWRYWRGGPFDMLKLKEIALNFSLFLIRFTICRRILDAEMKDGTRAGVGLKVKQKEKEPVRL